jgi:2-phospho-L-lactate guanylyltransferase
MSVYAVVAVRGLGAPKKRLSSVLNLEERKELTLAMLEDVLTALQGSAVDKIVVVTADSELCEFAGKFNAAPLMQKTSGLNAAVKEATEYCVENGAQAVLVLPADIPLLSTADVDAIVRLGKDSGHSVVLSQSYDGGTNALFQTPPNLIHTYFGRKSFSKHLNEAKKKGVCLKLHYSERLMTDIDSEEDLGKLLKTEGETACRRVLDQFGVASRLGCANKSS